MLRLTLLTTATVLTAATAVSCSGSEKPAPIPVGSTESGLTTEKPDVPSYTVSDGSQPNLLIAAVDTGYEQDQYESIVADIAGKHTADSGTFIVAFTCRQPTPGIVSRLAYGSFTAGQDTAKVRPFNRATCPTPPPPNLPTDPSGLTAAAVFDAIIVATGLPTELPTDNPGLCAQIRCVQTLGGDGVTVTQFPNEAEVSNAARLWLPEEIHVKGDIMLKFQFGGSTGTTPERAGQYRAVLDGLPG